MFRWVHVGPKKVLLSYVKPACDFCEGLTLRLLDAYWCMGNAERISFRRTVELVLLAMLHIVLLQNTLVLDLLVVQVPEFCVN